jgi:hypothetical protein
MRPWPRNLLIGLSIVFAGDGISRGAGAGKPDGRDEEFYHQAEKKLNEGVTGEEKSETFRE